MVIGRFAPSPTGALHLGSLCTALASFLDARSQNGFWYLRIDDLDTARNVQGAADDILKTLDTLGLHWDGEVFYQTRHLSVYRQIIDDLLKQQLVYPCSCSRKDLIIDGNGVLFYPGTCRNHPVHSNTEHALRVKTDDRVLLFEDELQGSISQCLLERGGDFIVRRKDQIIAYQFAVVVDDWLQKITRVVRGADLLLETPKQIYLQQLLNFSSPKYQHVAVLTDSSGNKLSKQTLAPAVDVDKPQHVIFKLLTLMRQNPSVELLDLTVTELLDWAISHWNPHSLKSIASITV